MIKETAPQSTPWWAPTVVPPKGAPNILLIMTDDQGYGVSGTFGGVIPTPALDRVGFVAMILASANVVGGFVVTDRMLQMFKKREPPRRDKDGA